VRLEGEVGVLAPGTAADVVIANIDPLLDLAAFAEPDVTLAAIVCRGEVIMNRVA